MITIFIWILLYLTINTIIYVKIMDKNDNPSTSSVAKLLGILLAFPTLIAGLIYNIIKSLRRI